MAFASDTSVPIDPPPLRSQHLSVGDHFIEKLRRQIRELMPRSAYSRISAWTDFFFAVRALGFRQFRSASTNRDSKLEALTVRNFIYPFWIRPQTSDLNEFIGTVLRENYGQYTPHYSVHTILDAGANIGDATVWYLNKFPDATVIAIEPHSANFELLARNCKPYGSRVKLLRAALWKRSQQLSICESRSHAGHYTSEHTNGQECDAICMRDLMANFGLTQIDIFKCDIEGSEETVLQYAEQWEQRTKSMVIELHTPRAHVLMAQVAQRRNWQHHQHRNLHYYIGGAPVV